MEFTTIRVSKEMADELHGRKNRGDSYDDVVRRLVGADRPERESTPGATRYVDRDPKGRTGENRSVEPATPAKPTIDDVVNELDVGRSLEETRDRRRAARAALEWLRDDADRPVTKALALDELYPEHAPDDQRENTYWKNVVRKAFSEAADVGLVDYDAEKRTYEWVQA